MLYDEPTSSLDPELVDEVRQGVVLEAGPPGRVLAQPVHERTRQFLLRILYPL